VARHAGAGPPGAEREACPARGALARRLDSHRAKFGNTWHDLAGVVWVAFGSWLTLGMHGDVAMDG
jgi:hypothetical protein